MFAQSMLQRFAWLLIWLVVGASSLPGRQTLLNIPSRATLALSSSRAQRGAHRGAAQQCSRYLFYGSDPFAGKHLDPITITCNQPTRDSVHPCPKNLQVMRWIVQRASRPGETICDPFCGRGTTLRAAKDLGRKAIGIDSDERYCERAVEYLSQEVLQFSDPSPQGARP